MYNHIMLGKRQVTYCIQNTYIKTLVNDSCSPSLGYIKRLKLIKLAIILELFVNLSTGRWSEMFHCVTPFYESFSTV